MKKAIRLIGSLLISVCMVLTILPTVAFAADTSNLKSYSGCTVSTASELKSSLEATTPQTINVTTDITLVDNITVGANHTLNIADGCTLFTGENTVLTIPIGKTLTLSGKGTLKVNNKTAEIGIAVSGKLESNDINIIVANCQNNGGFGYGIFLDSSSHMQMCGGKLNIVNSNALGIGGDGMLSVDKNCLVTIENVLGKAGSGTKGIDTNFTVKNSTVQVQATEGCTGINLNRSKKLSMENAVINVKNTGSGSLGLALTDNDNITANTNSKLILAEGSVVYGLANKLSNKGTILINNNRITVGSKDATPSADGLSAGDYTWNGKLFAKSVTTPPSGNNNTSYSPYSSYQTTTAQKIMSALNETNPSPIVIGNTSNNEFSSIKSEIPISKIMYAQKTALKNMTEEQIETEIKKVIDAISTVNTTNILQKAKEKINEVKKGLSANAKIIPINFTAHAIFAFPVEVTIQLDKSLYSAGTYYLYYYNEETEKLEDCGIVTVDSDSNATFTIYHCSDYFISNVQIDLTAIEKDRTSVTTDISANPQTGDDSCIIPIFILMILSATILLLQFLHLELRKRNLKFKNKS